MTQTTSCDYIHATYSSFEAGGTKAAIFQWTQYDNFQKRKNPELRMCWIESLFSFSFSFDSYNNVVVMLWVCLCQCSWWKCNNLKYCRRIYALVFLNYDTLTFNVASPFYQNKFACQEKLDWDCRKCDKDNHDDHCFKAWLVLANKFTFTLIAHFILQAHNKSIDCKQKFVLLRSWPQKLLAHTNIKERE